MILSFSLSLSLNIYYNLIIKYSPEYKFSSPKIGVTLDIPDSYNYRKEMLTSLCEYGKKWILLTMTHAPSETRSSLQVMMLLFIIIIIINLFHTNYSQNIETIFFLY